MIKKNKRTNTVDCHIAQRLQLRRVMLGMSQTDLAKRCGISFQQIQKYESYRQQRTHKQYSLRKNDCTSFGAT